MGSIILESKGLCKNFGGLKAIDTLNLILEEGEIRGLIGPNGAGKTTFFNLITGRIRPSQGRVFFKGEDITGIPVHDIVRKGMTRKFQSANIFLELSLFNNIAIPLMGKGSLKDIFFLTRHQLKEEIDEILNIVGLYEKCHETALNLSHGEKQWLEIGMCLANHPALLLLDEPTSGMSPHETDKTIELIKGIASSKQTIFIIEHDMYFIRNVAEKITVLHQGNTLLEGPYSMIEHDERVRKVYLGKENG